MSHLVFATSEGGRLPKSAFANRRVRQSVGKIDLLELHDEVLAANNMYCRNLFCQMVATNNRVNYLIWRHHQRHDDWLKKNGVDG